MRRLLTSSWLWLLFGLTLVAGATLVATAAWTRPLVEGQRAQQEGRFEEALMRYAAAESRFDRLPITKQLLSTAYRTGQTSQLHLLYRLNHYDAVIEKAGSGPSTAESHFWSGCALFEKALSEREEEEGDARTAWFSRAEEEFRRALTLNSDDWDTKYNYELTRRLLVELRKQPKTPPSQILRLLRPQPRPGSQPTRRVG